jgi:hypothetical protein
MTKTTLTSDELDLILNLLENNRNMDEFFDIELYDSAIDKVTEMMDELK